MKQVLNFIVNGTQAVLKVLHLTTANRIVLALSPLLAAGAGLIAAMVAQLVPGANLGAGELTSVFIAGSTLVSAKILLWLNGWQKREASDRLAAQGRV